MSGFVARVPRAAVAVSLESFALGDALFKFPSLHTAAGCGNPQG